MMVELAGKPVHELFDIIVERAGKVRPVTLLPLLTFVCLAPAIARKTASLNVPAQGTMMV